MAVIGMMAFTSCSTEKEELKEVKKTELNAKLADLGEGSWYTFETINGVEYVVVNGLKAKEIIAIANGTCESCRTECSYVRNLGGGSHIVRCGNGHTYMATNCGEGWTVRDISVQEASGHIAVASPC